MQQNGKALHYLEGKLPSMAPLANPYVPYQLEDSPKYEPGKALIRGTLFPGLDLPFMGMINKKEQPRTPLTELQTLSFLIQELALYLDTHQQDQEALEVYRQMQRVYNQQCKVYEEAYGPLTHMNQAEGPYRWLDQPWPWVYPGKQED